MQTSVDTTLTLVRKLNAPIEKVFDAWFTAEALSQWFAPQDSYTTIVHTLEARHGGHYRIEMISPEKESYIVSGKYLEVDKPHKLVFSWSWDHDKTCDSLVSVVLTSKDGYTELVLTHSGLPTETAAQLHEEGWTGCLSRLPQAL